MMADKANGVLYAERETDSPELMQHYMRHVDHMTRECLHAKSAIAAELAWRDWCVEQLQARLEAAERDALEERASWMKVCEASHYRRLREKFGWDSKFCRARAKAEAERIAYCIDAQRQEGK